MAFKTTVANQILNKLLRNVDFTPPTSFFVALHTGDPGETGASEATGGSYIRQAVSFNAASSKSCANSAQIEFAGMPAGTFTHFSIWDAQTNGTFIWGGQLGTSKLAGAGDTLRFAAGAITTPLT
jgi:hypothetical protein